MLTRSIVDLSQGLAKRKIVTDDSDEEIATSGPPSAVPSSDTGFSSPVDTLCKPNSEISARIMADSALQHA